MRLIVFVHLPVARVHRLVPLSLTQVLFSFDFVLIVDIRSNSARRHTQINHGDGRLLDRRETVDTQVVQSAGTTVHRLQDVVYNVVPGAKSVSRCRVRAFGIRTKRYDYPTLGCA